MPVPCGTVTRPGWPPPPTGSRRSARICSPPRHGPKLAPSTTPPGELRPAADLAGRRARDCLDRCEGAWTPALIPQEILAPSLTPRQREVAGLVALGLSNREVAGKLYVSLRTVENHLYQVYAKLDVSDRKGLARRLCALATA